MKRSGLVAIDVQNDFCPEGMLPVNEGDEVVPVLNRYIELFKAAGFPVFATRDWHPKETIHFRQFGGLWPPHCLQGTFGAEFHPDFKLPKDAVIISAGDTYGDEGYSGFEGHDEHGRPFAEVLKEAGVEHLYVGGLATDYCVRQTVLDALKRGFRVTVLLDAVRGIDLKEGDSARAIDEMIENGATTSTIDELELT